MLNAIHLDDIFEHVIQAQHQLLREKQGILNSFPPESVQSRESYAFSYVRAAHQSNRIIEERLADLSELPIHIDPIPEKLSAERRAMNRWIHACSSQEPGPSDFGNEFVHILTRCALRFGWNTPTYEDLLSRIAQMFYDLTCFLNTAYYLMWLEENGVEKVAMRLTPNLHEITVNLEHIAKQPETFVVSQHSPEERARRKQALIKGPNTKNKPRRRGAHLHVVQSQPTGPNEDRHPRA